MSALNQAGLFAVCRSLYEQAGVNYVLPPLTRDVEETRPAPRSQYILPAGEFNVLFEVALDEGRADRNASPSFGLPVRFRTEIRDRDGAQAGAPDDAQTYELIRAFWLGARMPINVEPADDGFTHRLSLQLASTFNFGCGHLTDRPDATAGRDFCALVAEAIARRTSHFFGDRQNGLAVWRIRAAQELFGDPRPSAEAFWPRGETTAAVTVPPHTTARASRGPSKIQRYVLAASLIGALVTPATLFGRLALQTRSPRAGVAHLPSSAPLAIAIPPAGVHEIALAGFEGEENDGPAGPPAPMILPPAAPALIAPSAVAPALRGERPGNRQGESGRRAPGFIEEKTAKPRGGAIRHAKQKAVAPASQRTNPKKRAADFKFANPLPRAKQAVASLTTGVVNSIKRVPDRLAALAKSN